MSLPEVRKGSCAQFCTSLVMEQRFAAVSRSRKSQMLRRCSLTWPQASSARTKPATTVGSSAGGSRYVTRCHKAPPRPPQ